MPNSVEITSCAHSLLVPFLDLYNTINIERVTQATFSRFIEELVRIANGMFPEDQRVAIILDNARPHLDIDIPAEFRDRFYLKYLPPYSPFLNPTEQANSSFKAAVKRELTRPDIQLEFDNREAANKVGITLTDHRARTIVRIGRQNVQTITVAKCLA